MKYNNVISELYGLLDSMKGNKKKLVKCPNCGYVFSIYYARAFSCTSCPLSVRGCNYIKCPNCGHEFPIGGNVRG